MRSAARLSAVLFVARSFSAAAAQDVLATPEDQARDHFERANAAISSGRLTDARDHLEGALRVFPTPATAFNLSIALRGIGSTVRALEVLDALIAGTYGPLSEDRRTEAAALRDAVALEIATVELRVCGSVHPEVRVDGIVRETLDDCAWRRIPLDAGRHAVEVTAPGFMQRAQTLTVGRGEIATFDWTLVPLPATPHRRRVIASPWFWIGTGLVVAAGVTAVVLLRPDAPKPQMEPPFGHVWTLSAEPGGPP